MIITFGKHKGSDARVVLFNHPDYVRWVLNNSGSTGGFIGLQKEFKKRVAQIDAKSFAACCRGECKRMATRTTAYRNSPDLFPWCDECDPHSLGASIGKLYEVRTYADAEKHVAQTCGGTKANLKKIIRELAKEKGMASKFTLANITQFLP